MTAILDRPRSIRHHFEPRGAAIQLLKCRAGEVLMAGPAGTGKSRACLEKVHLLALANPESRALLLRKTQKSLASTGLVTFRQKVAKEGIANGVLKWFGGSTEQPAGYRYANGSFVAVGGLDDPDKIMSSEYDAIYVQEATDVTEDDWEACTSRLRNGVISFQQLMADCNPAQSTHWLNVRCHNGQTVMLHSRHEDNPLYFDDHGVITDAGRQYIEGVLDKLTGVRYLRLRKGIWAAAEGLVYDEFDPATHLVDRLPAGAESWTRWWSIDFGYSNPFVLQCWAEDPDGRLWLYREIYMTRRLVEDHVKTIRKIVCPNGIWNEPKPRAIVCDHNAEDRATFERHMGLMTMPARKAPTAAQKQLVALQETQTRFKPAGDGKPRLLLVRDALVERDQALVDAKLPTCTAEEITGYVWPSGVKPDQREHPVKENDHGCDAMRYIVGQVDLGKTKWMRWVA